MDSERKDYLSGPDFVCKLFGLLEFTLVLDKGVFFVFSLISWEISAVLSIRQRHEEELVARPSPRNGISDAIFTQT